MRVGLDCSNGSTSSIAKSVFDALGAKTYVIGNEPNGLNINKDCGSTHIENLQKFVLGEQTWMSVSHLMEMQTVALRWTRQEWKSTVITFYMYVESI